MYLYLSGYKLWIIATSFNASRKLIKLTKTPRLLRKLLQSPKPPRNLKLFFGTPGSVLVQPHRCAHSVVTFGGEGALSFEGGWEAHNPNNLKPVFSCLENALGRFSKGENIVQLICSIHSSFFTDFSTRDWILLSVDITVLFCRRVERYCCQAWLEKVCGV